MVWYALTKTIVVEKILQTAAKQLYKIWRDFCFNFLTSIYAYAELSGFHELIAEKKL